MENKQLKFIEITISITSYLALTQQRKQKRELTFSDPGNFRARKAIFSSSASKNGDLYASETSYMKGTSVHIKNMWIKQLWNRKVPNFSAAFRARKVSGVFERRALGERRTSTCFPPVMRSGPLGFTLILWRSHRRLRCRCLKSLIVNEGPGDPGEYFRNFWVGMQARKRGSSRGLKEPPLEVNNGGLKLLIFNF